MKKLTISLSLVMLLLMAVLTTGCSGIFYTVSAKNVVEKTYEFKDFTEVEISSAIHFEVKQSDTYTVIASTQENNIDHLDIHQSGNTLYVGRKIGLINLADTRVTITMPQLNKLAISGASSGYATGFDSTGNLDVNVSGASWLNMKIKAGESALDVSGSSKVYGDLTATDTQIRLTGASDLDMNMKTSKTVIYASGSSEVNGALQATDCQFNLSGASICELTGSTGNTVIEASGSSNMRSPELTLQSADIKLEGASSASIHTDGSLNIDLSGSSRLNYTGNSIIGKTDISGDSKLNHIMQ